MILSFMELGALIKFATIWFLFYEREFKNIKSTLWILNSLMFFESWITLSTGTARIVIFASVAQKALKFQMWAWQLIKTKFQL
jgi:hypothetical protein